MSLDYCEKCSENLTEKQIADKKKEAKEKKTRFLCFHIWEEIVKNHIASKKKKNTSNKK